MKTIRTSRGAMFAVIILLAATFYVGHSATAYSQQKPTFVVLYRTTPPPDDPNEWVIVVPSDSNFSALYAAGFHPVPPSGPGVFYTYTEAGTAADNFVAGMFTRVCRRAFSVFYHGITGEQRVVEDFAEKPFGFHLKQGGLCRAEALAMIGTPMTYTLLGKPGTNVPVTNSGFGSPVKPTPPIIPPKGPVKPPVVSEVQREVEEPPVKPPSGGGQPPVVEEIPEKPTSSGGSKPPQSTTPVVEEIPEVPGTKATQPPTQPTPSTSSIDTSGDWVVVWNWSVTTATFVGKLTGGGSQFNYQGSLEGVTGNNQWNPPKDSAKISCSLSGQPDSAGKMSCTATFPDSWQGEAEGTIQVMSYGEKRKFAFKGRGNGNVTGYPPAHIAHLDLKPRN